MAEQSANQNSSDEIDLGQLFQLIGRGFNKIGVFFLRTFLYLKKNALILGGLVILGAGIGYGLNQIVEKKLKIEVIVKPNLDSRNYLYNIIDEIENNIRSRDLEFFESMNVDVANISEFKVSIEPIEDKSNPEIDLDYLELLGKFQTDYDYSDLIRTELLNKSVLTHKITFLFQNPSEGKGFAQKTLSYINSRSFFKELNEITNQNAVDRIKKNEIFIDQIDGLISGYSQNLESRAKQTTDGQIILNSEEQLDVTGLLKLKKELMEDIEQKRIQLKEQIEPVTIINMGNPQMVNKPFFGKSVILIPSILLLTFFGISILIDIDKRASRI